MKVTFVWLDGTGWEEEIPTDDPPEVWDKLERLDDAALSQFHAADMIPVTTARKVVFKRAVKWEQRREWRHPRIVGYEYHEIPTPERQAEVAAKELREEDEDNPHLATMDW